MVQAVQFETLFTHLEAVEILACAMDEILKSDRNKSVTSSDIIRAIGKLVFEESQMRMVVPDGMKPPWANPQTKIKRKYGK